MVKYNHNWGDITYKKKTYKNDKGREISRKTHRKHKRSTYGHAGTDPDTGKIIFKTRSEHKKTKTYKLGDRDVSRQQYRAAKRRYRDKLYNEHMIQKGGGVKKGRNFVFNVADIIDNEYVLNKPFYWFAKPGPNNKKVFRFMLKEPKEGDDQRIKDFYEYWKQNYQAYKKLHNAKGKLIDSVKSEAAKQRAAARKNKNQAPKAKRTLVPIQDDEPLDFVEDIPISLSQPSEVHQTPVHQLSYEERKRQHDKDKYRILSDSDEETHKQQEAAKKKEQKELKESYAAMKAHEKKEKALRNAEIPDDIDTSKLPLFPESRGNPVAFKKKVQEIQRKTGKTIPTTNIPVTKPGKMMTRQAYSKLSPEEKINNETAKKIHEQKEKERKRKNKGGKN